MVPRLAPRAECRPLRLLGRGDLQLIMQRLDMRLDIMRRRGRSGRSGRGLGKDMTGHGKNRQGKNSHKGGRARH
jgi:hypothetical protein